MRSFTFEFSTAAGQKNAVSYHLNIHNQPSEAKARDVLVAQLEDLLKQAKALKVNDSVDFTDEVAAAAEPDAPADAAAEGEALPEDEVTEAPAKAPAKKAAKKAPAKKS